MYKKLLVLSVILAAFGFAGIKESVNNKVPDNTWPVQINFFYPVALPNNVLSVSGLRLNLGYGESSKVKGLDLGFVNNTYDEVTGVQIGLYNRSITAETKGIVVGLFNETEKKLCGIELGLYNRNYLAYTESIVLGLVNESFSQKGIQSALLWNKNEDTKGIQTSLFYNNARNLHGYQYTLLVNNATSVKGFQFGLLNFCDDLNGVQIGLLNFGKKRWFMPFVNF